MLFLRRTNIARFEKLSYEEFRIAFFNLFINKEYNKYYAVPDNIYSILSKRWAEYKDPVEEYIQNAYDNIVIPQAENKGSAGHDITVPFGFTLKPFFGVHDPNKFMIVMPTGLKVFIKKKWCLKFYPRSGWGNKGLKIENTVPVIDWDYYNSPKNEGHIFLKLTNENKEGEEFIFKGGETRIVQGLFEIYGTAGKPKNSKREGGFNSTSKEGTMLK